MREIREFTRDHPYNPITDDTIDKSAKTFANTTERVIHGIVYTDKNRPAVQDIIDMMDGPSTFWK